MKYEPVEVVKPGTYYATAQVTVDLTATIHANSKEEAQVIAAKVWENLEFSTIEADVCGKKYDVEVADTKWHDKTSIEVEAAPQEYPYPLDMTLSAIENAKRLIDAERCRQISSPLNYGSHYDSQWTENQLGSAALAYFEGDGSLWPWNTQWNPKTRVENLVRAGALIEAELDRLKRRRDVVFHTTNPTNKAGQDILKRIDLSIRQSEDFQVVLIESLGAAIRADFPKIGQ